MGRNPGASGVSVVIPHYGDPAHATALLADLAARAAERPIQIIVVDDHSPVPFPDDPEAGVDVLRRDSNGGFGAAVNSGAAVAVHPLLLILNSDLRVDPDFIESLCRLAEPWMPAIVGPSLLDEERSVGHSARRFPRIRTSMIAALVPLARWRTTEHWHRAVGHLSPAPSSGVVTCDWIEGAAMLMPTALFRELEGFDERFFMYSEEIDLQRRARQRGVPSIVLGDVSAMHHGGGSSEDGPRLGWLLQGEWIYLDTWRGRSAARRYQAAMFLAVTVNLVWNGLRAALGRTTRPLAGFTMWTRAIRGAPKR